MKNEKAMLYCIQSLYHFEYKINREIETFLTE